MNTNDPSGISALLDQLKASPAWQQLAATTPNQNPEPGAGPPSASESTAPRSEPLRGSSSTSTSVASLLAQLQGTSYPPDNFHDEANHIDPPHQPQPQVLEEVPVALPQEPSKDNRFLSFQQALPILSQLVDLPGFADALKKMKVEQDDLEKQLWTERQAVFTKYQEKFKVAQTKARLIGTSVSQHEIDMITDGFNKDIKKFDCERVLPAWDGLVSKQQQQMVHHGVPTMYLTSVRGARENQQKVMSVLESLAGMK